MGYFGPRMGPEGNMSQLSAKPGVQDSQSSPRSGDGECSHGLQPCPSCNPCAPVTPELLQLLTPACPLPYSFVICTNKTNGRLSERELRP